MLLEVTKNIHDWARSRPDFENGRTIKPRGDSRGRYIGNIGEFALSNALLRNGISHECVGSSVYDYDIRIGDLTIDVKSKERTFSYADRPKRLALDEAHVKEDQEGFPCSIYVFVSVTAESNSARATVAHIVGWCSKKSYWENCYRVKEGAVDGRYIEQADAGKLSYGMLRPMSEIYDCIYAHLTRRGFCDAT